MPMQNDLLVRREFEQYMYDVVLELWPEVGDGLTG
jgi:hypothetical protein